MKYSKKIIISIAVVIATLSISYVVDAYVNLYQIKDKMIRFHVLANSNSNEDQELKLKVRNNVISTFDEIFDSISSKDESEKIILEKIDDIRNIAQDTIKSEGYNYNVNVYYGNYLFPRKQYEEIVLPEGNYDAVRIEIGKAEGNNWWCVMFPPLCFVNFGKADSDDAVFDIDTEKKLNEVLSEDEIELIKAKRGMDDIKLKSKIFEIIERGKIENAGVYPGNEQIIYAASSSGLLKQGSRGILVGKIQTALKEKGYYDGEIDSIYGKKTLESVKAFQKECGLEQDGIVGTDTYEALGIKPDGEKKDDTQKSLDNLDPDVHLIARAVYGEARGEPYEGKVAVAAVILNRVEHTDFPDTVTGVVYQPGAFNVVDDGQINLTPDDESYRAVYDAMNGWDPSNQSLYYWNPATATSKWIWTRTVETKIANHWFGN